MSPLPVPAVVCTQRPLSHANLVWLKKRHLVKNAVEWSHVSATDCAVQRFWRALTSRDANYLIYFRGKSVIVEYNGVFFLPSNFYPPLAVLILQACTGVFQQSSLLSLIVILSLCWSLCQYKNSESAAPPNPKSENAAQSSLSYYTGIQASYRIWMWLIFSGKLFVSGWLLAAAGYTGSSSSPQAAGLRSLSSWLSHYRSIRV